LWHHNKYRAYFQWATKVDTVGLSGILGRKVWDRWKGFENRWDMDVEDSCIEEYSHIEDKLERGRLGQVCHIEGRSICCTAVTRL
jgi:hypothetical protein